MRRSLETFCVLVSMLMTTSASAEEPVSTKVTTSARAPMEAFASERSENVVKDGEIAESQATTFSEAVANETGVTIQSTNRGAGALILRGMIGPENLIVYDGVRFNQSTFRTGPNQYIDTLDPWGLRRIEVVRGPAGVLYGTGAMGGVVEAHPLALPDATDARGRFLYHSADDTAAVGVDAGSKIGAVSGRAGATLRRHGRLRVGTNGSPNEDFVSGVDGQDFLARGYEDVGLRGGFGVDVGRQRFRANYVGMMVRDAMRLDALGIGDVRFYDNDDHLAYVTAELDGPDGVDELRANVSWHRTRELATRLQCDAPGGRVRSRFACAAADRAVVSSERRNEDIVDTLGSSVVGTTRLLASSLQLNWGGDAYFDGVQSTRADARAPEFTYLPRDRGNFADGSTYRTIGVFGLGRYDLWTMGDRTLRVHGGARVENFGAHAPAVTAEIGDVDYSYTGLVGSAGVAWLVGTSLNAYLNWNQGYRAPNLQETTVLGDSGNFYEVPNPDLGPERSDTFELGTRGDWADILQVEAAVWSSLLSDRITRRPASFDGASEIDGKQVRERVNRDSAYLYGADLGVRTHSFKRMSAYGSVSWIDGAVKVDDDDPTFAAGPFHGLFAGEGNYENPRRLPPATMKLGMRYEASRAYFTIWASGAAAQTKLSPDDLADLRICEVDVGVLAAEVGQQCSGTPGWLTLNARAGYRFENVLIDLAALNLTDERYRRHGSGVLAPGFDVAAQVTLEY